MRIFEASRDQADPVFGARAGSQCMSNCFTFLHAAFLSDGRSLCHREALDAILKDGIRLDKLTDARLRQANGGVAPAHPYRLGTEIPRIIETHHGTTVHLLSRPISGTAVSQNLDGFILPGIFEFLRSAQRKPFPAHVIVTVGAHTRALLFGDRSTLTGCDGDDGGVDRILVFDPHATDMSLRSAVYVCDNLQDVVQVLSFFGAMVGDFYYDATFVYFLRCANPAEAAALSDEQLNRAIVDAYRDPDIDVPASTAASTPILTPGPGPTLPPTSSASSQKSSSSHTQSSQTQSSQTQSSQTQSSQTSTIPSSSQTRSSQTSTVPSSSETQSSQTSTVPSSSQKTRSRQTSTIPSSSQKTQSSQSQHSSREDWNLWLEPARPSQFSFIDWLNYNPIAPQRWSLVPSLSPSDLQDPPRVVCQDTDPSTASETPDSLEEVFQPKPSGPGHSQPVRRLPRTASAPALAPDPTPVHAPAPVAASAPLRILTPTPPPVSPPDVLALGSGDKNPPQALPSRKPPRKWSDTPTPTLPLPTPEPLPSATPLFQFEISTQNTQQTLPEDGILLLRRPKRVIPSPPPSNSLRDEESSVENAQRGSLEMEDAQRWSFEAEGTQRSPLPTPDLDMEDAQRDEGSLPRGSTQKTEGSIPTAIQGEGSSIPIEAQKERGSIPMDLQTERGSIPMDLQTERDSIPTDLQTERGSIPMDLQTERDSVPMDIQTESPTHTQAVPSSTTSSSSSASDSASSSASASDSTSDSDSASKSGSDSDSDSDSDSTSASASASDMALSSPSTWDHTEEMITGSQETEGAQVVPQQPTASRKRRASVSTALSTSSETEEPPSPSPTLPPPAEKTVRPHRRRRRLLGAERLMRILTEDATIVADFSQTTPPPPPQELSAVDRYWALVHDGAPAARDLLRDTGRQLLASLADAYLARDPARELDDVDAAEDHLRDLWGLTSDMDLAIDTMRSVGFSAIRAWRRLVRRLDLLQPAEMLVAAKATAVLRQALEDDAERVESWLEDLLEAMPTDENTPPAETERALVDFVRERPLVAVAPNPELCLDRAAAKRLAEPLRERREGLRRGAETREKTYRRLLDAVTKLGVATDAVSVLEKSDPRGLEPERRQRLESLAGSHAERVLSRIRREIHESLQRDLNQLLDGQLPKDTISRLTDETAQARDEVHALVTARLLPEKAYEPVARLYDELRYLYTGEELVDVPLSREVQHLRKQYEAGRARRDAAEARLRELLAQIEDMVVDEKSSSSSSSTRSPLSPMDTTSAGMLLRQTDELMSIDGGSDSGLTSDDDPWPRRRSRAVRQARATAAPAASESDDQKARDFLARLTPGEDPPAQSEVQTVRALAAVLAFDEARRGRLIGTLGQWLQHLFERLADYDPPKEDWSDRLRYLAERLPAHEPRRLTLLAVTATAGQLARRVRQALAAKQSGESLEALLELLELRRGDLERISGGDWAPALRGLRDRVARELQRQRIAALEQTWEAQVKTTEVDSPEALARLLATAPSAEAAARVEPGLRERLRRAQEAAEKRRAADEQRVYETRRQKVTADLRTLAESFASPTPSLFATVDRSQTRAALEALRAEDREAALLAFRGALATALGRLATAAAQARLRYATAILDRVDPIEREKPGDAALLRDDLDEARRDHARTLLREDAVLLNEETARGLQDLYRDLAGLLRLRRHWQDPATAFADGDLAKPYAELMLWHREAETLLATARAARARELEDRRRVLRQPPPPPGEAAASHDAAVKAAEATLTPPDAFPQGFRRRTGDLHPAPFREAAKTWLARADALLEDELVELNLALRAEAARRRQIRGSHEAAWRQTATALRLRAPTELRVDATALAQDPLAVAARTLQALETLPYLVAHRGALWLLDLLDALIAEADARTPSDGAGHPRTEARAHPGTEETSPHDALMAVLRGDRAPDGSLRNLLRELRERAAGYVESLADKLADDARASALAAALADIGIVTHEEAAGDVRLGRTVTNEERAPSGTRTSPLLTHVGARGSFVTNVVDASETETQAGTGTAELSELRATLHRLDPKRMADGEARYRRLVALATSGQDRLARAEELELLRGVFFQLARALRRQRYGLDFAAQLRLLTAFRERLVRWRQATTRAEGKSGPTATAADTGLPERDTAASAASLLLGVEALERFVTAQRDLLERLAARQPAVSGTVTIPARPPNDSESQADEGVSDPALRLEVQKLAAVDPSLGLYVVTDVFGERRLMTASGLHLDLLATHGNFVFAACAANPPSSTASPPGPPRRWVTRRYRAVTVSASIAATLQAFWADIARYDVRHLVGPVNGVSAAALEREAARQDPAAARQVHVLSNLKLFSYLITLAWRESEAADASPLANTADPSQTLAVSTLDLVTLLAARHPEFVYAAATAAPERALRAFVDTLDRRALERAVSSVRNPPAQPLNECRAFAFDPTCWIPTNTRERLWDSPFVRQLCTGHPRVRDVAAATKLFQYLLALRLLPPAVLRCAWSQFRPGYATRLPSLEALTGLVAEYFFRPFEPLEPEPTVEPRLRGGERVERRLSRRPRAPPPEAVEFARRESVLDYVLGSYVFGVPLTCGAHAGDVAGGQRRVVIRHLENVPSDPDFVRVLRARDVSFVDLDWAAVVQNPGERAWFSLQEERLRQHLRRPPAAPSVPGEDPQAAIPLVLYDATDNYVVAVVQPPPATPEADDRGLCLQPPAPPARLWLRGDAFAVPPLTLPDGVRPADLSVVPQDVGFLTRQPVAADSLPLSPDEETSPAEDAIRPLFAQRTVFRPVARDAVTTVSPEAASDSFLTHPTQMLTAAVRAAVRILRAARARLLDLESSLADTLRRIRILYLH